MNLFVGFNDSLDLAAVKPDTVDAGDDFFLLAEESFLRRLRRSSVIRRSSFSVVRS